MSVLDASALLAFLLDEEGADQVDQELEAGAVCGAANWSEVVQKSLAAGCNWAAASGLLASYPLVIEPVTADDAEWAAGRWRPGEGLSLADRLCLALAHRLDVDAITADKAWGQAPGIRQLR